MEHWLLELVERFGYVGLFVATLIESTFVPIPAEVTMVPAGILAAQGVFTYTGVMVSSVLGIIAGSLVNYVFAVKFGRSLLLKYGHYIFIKPEFLTQTERFFARYGSAAIFIGRLLPVIKHYISFVAGIGRMPMKPFIIYTALGGTLWCAIMLHIGYLAELSAQATNSNLGGIGIVILGVALVSLLAWLVKRKLMP